jgi:hypothetical protein
LLLLLSFPSWHHQKKKKAFSSSSVSREDWTERSKVSLFFPLLLPSHFLLLSLSLSLSQKSHFLLYLLFYTITHYSNRLNVV